MTSHTDQTNTPSKGITHNHGLTGTDTTVAALRKADADEATARKAADTALGLRIDALGTLQDDDFLRLTALEARPTFTQSEAAVLRTLIAANGGGGGTPVPAQSVRQFPGTGPATPAALASMCADMAVDAIEIAAGTYHGWRNCHVTADRTSRPLAIRRAAGAAVVFDAASDGDYGDQAFYLDGCSHISFGDGLAFQHYLMAETGVFLMVGAHHISVGAVSFAHIAGNATAADEESAHLFYISRGSHDISLGAFTASRLQASDEAGGVHGLNGVHVYTGGTGAAVYNVSVSGASISDANWAMVCRNSTTGIAVSGVTVANCGHGGVPAAVDFDSGCTGTVSGTHTTGSVGTPHAMGSMTDGGGNSWA
jgi:hypothetical protein